MKIYTKTGDEGQTSLFGGKRVPKDDLRIQSYGTLDELNAVLGMVITQLGPQSQMRTHLGRIQAELFQLGAELATPPGKTVKMALLDDTCVELLEKEIDSMEADLPPLKTFILPGGALSAAFLHLARTVCRRAERDLVGLNRVEPVRSVVIRYLNRLSDYLFVSGRHANWEVRISDLPWIAPQ